MLILKAMPKTTRRMVDVRRPTDVGAPLAGKISKVLITDGEVVSKGQVVMIISAMKMVSQAP